MVKLVKQFDGPKATKACCFHHYLGAVTTLVTPCPASPPRHHYRHINTHVQRQARVSKLERERESVCWWVCERGRCENIRRFLYFPALCCLQNGVSVPTCLHRDLKATHFQFRIRRSNFTWQNIEPEGKLAFPDIRPRIQR